MNKIILEQQTEQQIINKVKQISNSTTVYDTITQKGVDLIVRQLNSDKETYNFFQNIFNKVQKKPQKKQTPAPAPGKLTLESKFLDFYNSIISEQQKPAESNENKQQPTIPQTADQKTDAAKSETEQKSQDQKKALADLSAQTGTKSSDDMISLIVTAKDDFEFVTDAGEKIESKQTLNKLDSYLKSHPEILSKQIAEYKAKNRSDKLEALQEGIQKATLLINDKSINKEQLTKYVQNIISHRSKLWINVIKLSGVKFGDGFANKKQYYKDFCITIAYTIYIIANENKDISKIKAQITDNKISNEQIYKKLNQSIKNKLGQIIFEQIQIEKEKNTFNADSFEDSITTQNLKNNNKFKLYNKFLTQLFGEKLLDIIKITYKVNKNELIGAL